MISGAEKHTQPEVRSQPLILENRKLLTVSGKDEESYTFILKNMPKVNNVKNVSSWKYDKNKKELRIQAKGSELKIQIL